MLVRDMTNRERIDDFLGQKRLAIVGVSRQPQDFTRLIFREFVRRGYDAVPVNPAIGEVEGRRCFPRVQDIAPPVDGVMLLTPPKKTESVVLDCAAAGVTRVWMYRAVGKGAVSQAAVRFCKANGIHVVPGYCPHMFWPDAAFFHRFHATLAKITGVYPR